MFCINCGKQIDDNSKFCPYCGGITQNIPENNIQESANLFEKKTDKKTHKKTEWKSNLILIIIAVAICILGTVIVTAIDNKNHEESHNIIEDIRSSNFEFLPDITIGELLDNTHSWLEPNNEGEDDGMWKTMNGSPTFWGVDDETGITLEITFSGYYQEAGIPTILKTRINTPDNPELHDISDEDFKNYILDLYTRINDKDTIKETTDAKTAETEQTTVTSKKTTVTTSKKTTAKPTVKTYDITFEADELLDEAGLMMSGHEAVAVLSNLTCSNGTATVETNKIYTYESLVRVKVTGAEAGDITLGGTITTYGLDTYQGETVSYPVNSGVFLIKRTIGNNSGSSSNKTTTAKKAPSISGNITKQNSSYGGYDIYINVSGNYDYYNYKYYEKSMGSSSSSLIASGEEDKSSFRVSGFSAGVSSVYADITPYNNDGTSGEEITISLDIENDNQSSAKEKAKIYSCNKSGQINCHGGTVAGFTKSYVAEGGSVGKVCSSLGDGWHVTAYNYCTSMGITWYELYDSDDGDYYGWVDSNYIDFYY